MAATKARKRKPQPAAGKPPLRLEWLDPADLDANPLNWRRHPEPQTAALRAALNEVGWAGALLYNERTKRLIDGHARKEIKSGERVPVLVGSWSEDDERKILATLDPLAAMATADTAALDALLKSVSVGDEALRGMLAELGAANPPPLPEAGVGGDDFDTTPADGPTRTQRGDLWVIGGVHRLLVGDCTGAANVERLMGGERAAAVATDPPFGVRDDQWDTFKTESDFGMFTGSWLRVAYQHAGLIACFFADKFVPLLLAVAAQEQVPYRRALVWRKPPGSQFAGASLDGFWFDFELIQVFGAPSFGQRPATRMACLEHRTVTGQGHGCEKPVALLADLIEGYSDHGDLVVDPFLGSGTTLIAAHRLGRRCYGLEIEPRYADVILKRAEAEGLTCEKAA